METQDDLSCGSSGRQTGCLDSWSDGDPPVHSSSSSRVLLASCFMAVGLELYWEDEENVLMLADESTSFC